MGVTGKHYCCDTSLHAFDIGGAFETPTVRELSNLVTPKPVFNWATVAELSGSIRVWSKRVPCADFQGRNSWQIFWAGTRIALFAARSNLE